MQKLVSFVLSSKPHLWLQHLLKIFKALNIFTRKSAKNTSRTISFNQTPCKRRTCQSFPIQLSLSPLIFLLLCVFPSLLFCCYHIFFSVKHRLANLLSLIAVFWGSLQELATHQWLVPGVVRRGGQSFSLPIAKLLIPAGLCSPKQACRLQASHQRAHWASCEPELLLWYQDRAAPRTADWWWPLETCFQRSEPNLKHKLFAHTCSEAFVFVEDDQVMEIMQNLAQQFVTTI